MKRTIFVALAASAFISSTAAISIGTGSAVPPQVMDRAEYQAALAGLEAERPVGLAHCDRLAVTERETCRVELAALEMVRAAEIEQAFRRSEASARALQRARIDARYQVERARCASLGGGKRDHCYVLAHANKGRAMLDAAAPYDTRI